MAADEPFSPVATSVLPLESSSREREELPAPGHDPPTLSFPSAGSARPRGLEWALSELQALPARRRSCVSLSHAEPCVNKAVYHLGLLRSRLAGRAPARGTLETGAECVTLHGAAREVLVSPPLRKESGSLRNPVTLASKSIQTFASDFEPPRAQSVTIGGDGETHASDNPLGHLSFEGSATDSRTLYIKGASTGSVLQKGVHDQQRSRKTRVMEGGFSEGDVVLKALDLVVRLEEDRQQALELHLKEREKVCEFRECLDRAAEERLDRLRRVVQEGEEGVREGGCI